MKAQHTVTHGWFTDPLKLRPERSYWIAAASAKGERRRHYLGRRTHHKTWQWKEPHKGAADGEPPEGTQFIAYREVGSEPFSPYQGGNR